MSRMFLIDVDDLYTFWPSWQEAEVEIIKTGDDYVIYRDNSTGLTHIFLIKNSEEWLRYNRFYQPVENKESYKMRKMYWIEEAVLRLD